MANALQQDIQRSGWNQGDVVAFLENVRDLCNELQTDHATTKTTVDAARTAIIELIDDHATNIAVIAELKTAVNAIITAATSDSATNIAAVTPVSGSPAATLTAGDPAAGPATLTNSTALKLTKG